MKKLTFAIAALSLALLSVADVSAQPETIFPNADHKAAARAPIAGNASNAALQWSIRSKTNAMNDSRDVFATIQSSNVVKWSEYDSGRVKLTIRCWENRTAAIFTDAPLATGFSRPMFHHHGHRHGRSKLQTRYRFDSDAVRSRAFDPGSGNHALGLWHGDGIPLIKEMIGKSKPVVELQPYGENAVQATFDISRSDGAIQTVREACGWRASSRPFGGGRDIHSLGHTNHERRTIMTITKCASTARGRLSGPDAVVGGRGERAVRPRA